MKNTGRLENEAKKAFQKLPKREQKRINGLKRVPVPFPGGVFDKKMNAPRKKKWDADD